MGGVDGCCVCMYSTVGWGGVLLFEGFEEEFYFFLGNREVGDLSDLSGLLGEGGMGIKDMKGKNDTGGLFLVGICFLF